MKRVDVREGRGRRRDGAGVPERRLRTARLPSAIAEAAQGWRIEELHTEEGRLDEVFRSITMPDTAAAKETK